MQNSSTSARPEETAAQLESELEGLAGLLRGVADPARLRILNLLMQAGEVSGREVEAVTGYGASKVSRHFAYLKQAGWVRDRRDGLWIHYGLRPGTGAARARLAALIGELPSFYDLLAQDAARLKTLAAKPGGTAKPQDSPQPGDGARPGAPSSGKPAAGSLSRPALSPKKNVLLLCQSNVARSQMAEGFLRKYGAAQFEVFSAGLTAGPAIHPLALRVMEEAGVPLTGQRPKAVSDFLGRKTFAHVITLCLEVEEECPRIFPGVSAVERWPFEDVANARLPEADQLARFRVVRDRIEQRVKQWLKD